MANVNVAIVGHVDSGKTSVAKLLSTTASTACFDKSPQSQQRGITLDLGFSSFQLPGADAPLVTLVDCPGHASLFRSVLGGAQIIDAFILVLDALKGIQTQTAECLVLAEIIAKPLVVLLNKTDLLPDVHALSALEKRIGRTLEALSLKDVLLVRCSTVSPHAPQSREGIMRALKTALPSRPARSAKGSFLMAVDHCFAIKGQGTIATGTILRGAVSVGDAVEVAVRKCECRVKSLQSFRRPVCTASQGDRIGLCLPGLDPAGVERTLVYAPDSQRLVTRFVMEAHRIRHYRLPCRSKSRLHRTAAALTHL